MMSPSIPVQVNTCSSLLE